MTTPAGPYEHRGAYGPEAAAVLPMPDLVTYTCDCGAQISHRDPFEAHALYVDHMDEHDLEPDEDPRDPDPLTDAEVAELVPLTDAEVLADEELAAQFYEDEVPD